MQRRLGLDLEVPDEFGIGLAWYSAAEAHFGARIQLNRRDGYRNLALTYRFGLRADDKPALEYIQDTLGIGKIYLHQRREKNANLTVIYQVTRAADLYHVIVPLFDKYPIPSQFRKAREFETWKQIVEIHYHQGGPPRLGAGPGGKSSGCAPIPQSYWDKIEPLVEQLKAARQYQARELRLWGEAGQR